ncbi:MAG: phenylalanine--tRNA ligase subunit beta [Candidatus Pacearchaeota archaeon]
MTNITLNRKEVEKHLGKIDEELQNRIISIGIEIEELNEKEIVLGITPNRPDLLSLQGFLRNMNFYLGKKKPFTYIAKENKEYEVIIEKSVKEVRPFTACAVAKNLKFNDEKIKEIINIQEKLHLTLGRNRRKVAIGIYPLEKIKFPIRFLAKKPKEIVFRPLEFDKEIDGLKILKEHPTGKEYSHLLEGKEVFPIFEDANRKILSMPPIINSHEIGKITNETKDIFIECSGFNPHYLGKVLNIICCALIDMGAEIYKVKIKKGWFSYYTPDFSEERIEFTLEQINNTIGLNLKEKEIEKLLQKMGIKTEKTKKNFFALIPPYRVDILNWSDVAEEVAIAYGYENIGFEIPSISNIAEEDKSYVMKRKLGEILNGLGFLECSSLHLNTKEEIKKMNYQFKDFIEIENSKTEYSTLRIDLMTNILKIFSENSDSQYPQKIFEIGPVFSLDNNEETGIKEKQNLAIAICDNETNFTEIKRVLDYLFKMIDKKYLLKETENSNFILGRVGKIIVDEKEIGFIGEIAPRVLKNWKINFPVTALEICINDFLFN